MKTTLLAAAAAIGLFAVPAFAGEGNGDPFALRTPAAAPSSVMTARPDTGSENTPNVNIAFSQPANPTWLASNASEATVQPAGSLPAGALEGNFAYAQGPRPAVAARVVTATR